MNSTSAIHRTGVASSHLPFSPGFPPKFTVRSPTPSARPPASERRREKWESIVIDWQNDSGMAKQREMLAPVPPLRGGWGGSGPQLGWWRAGDFLGWGCWKPFPSHCLCWVIQECQPQVCHCLGWLQTPQNGPRPPKCCNLSQMATSPPKQSQIPKCCKASGWFYTPQNAAIPPINSKLSRRLQPPQNVSTPQKVATPMDD